MLLSQHRVRQPAASVGREITFADGSSSRVYRETVIADAACDDPVVLIVGFRLRRVRSERAHALFRLESELNTVLFAGFPGLVSKLWMRHDQNHLYRGVYQWNGEASAVAYVSALWWALVAVSERSSIEYHVLPGLARDDVLAHPDLAPDGGQEWWRPLAGL